LHIFNHALISGITVAISHEAMKGLQLNEVGLIIGRDYNIYDLIHLIITVDANVQF